VLAPPLMLLAAPADDSRPSAAPPLPPATTSPAIGSSGSPINSLRSLVWSRADDSRSATDPIVPSSGTLLDTGPLRPSGRAAAPGRAAGGWGCRAGRARDETADAGPPAVAGGPAGRVIAGRYELRQLIGSGGMARVYLAWDRQLDQKVAVKLLS